MWRVQSQRFPRDLRHAFLRRHFALRETSQAVAARLSRLGSIRPVPSRSLRGGVRGKQQGLSCVSCANQTERSSSRPISILIGYCKRLSGRLVYLRRRLNFQNTIPFAGEETPL